MQPEPTPCQDWLPYRNDPNHNDLNWGAGERGIWIHSLRGDWSEKYWDKTANQAYHFWFYVAVTFFDGAGYGIAGNEFHDHLLVTNYDFINSPEWEVPPHPRQSTNPDRALGYAGMRLGSSLRLASFIQEQNCSDELAASLRNFDLGMWIRSNLKD